MSLSHSSSFNNNNPYTTLDVACVCVCVCVWDTHNGAGLCDEEEFSECSVQRQQHSDTGGILAQAVLHRHEELPQRSQQCQLTGSGAQTHPQLDKQTIMWMGRMMKS